MPYDRINMTDEEIEGQEERDRVVLDLMKRVQFLEKMLNLIHPAAVMSMLVVKDKNDEEINDLVEYATKIARRAEEYVRKI